MAKTIKGITVEIGGNTTKLSQAISGAEKNAKSLRTELTQVDKALKLDPTNIDLLKQKQQLLTESIAETASKLKTLESAQEQVKRQYESGEIDSGAYRAFERELESARASLKRLEQEQKEVEKASSGFTQVKNKLSEIKGKTEPVVKGFKDVASAAGTAAAAVGKVAFEAGKIEAKAISAAGDAFDKYVKGLTVAATAITGLTVSAAGFADDINTISAKTGIATDELQKMSYAAKLIDVDVETMTGSMSKLIKNMNSARSGTGSAADAFGSLGISVTDSNGQLRDSQEVFAEAISALGDIENETERDATAMAIFGKSAQELNPLILGGADALQDLGEKAEEAGLILGQDSLDKLHSFNDSLDILKSNAAGTGRVIALDFSAGLKKMTDIIGDGLPDLGKSFAKMFTTGNTKDFSKAISQMADDIVKLAAKNAPNLVNGFNGLILGIAGSITATLPTVVTDVLPVMMTGFQDLITGLVDQLPIVAPILVQGGVVLFTGLIDSLNLVVDQLTPMLPELVGTISEALVDNVPVIIDSGLTLLEGVITGIADNVDELVETVTELIPVIIDTLTDHLPEIIRGGMEITLAIVKGIADNFPEIVSAVADLAGGLLYELLSYLPDVLLAGMDIVESLAKGIGSLFTPVGNAIGDLFKAIKNTFKGWWHDLENIGGDIIDGIITGFKNGIDTAINAVQDFGDAWLTGIKDIFGIHSPSALMRDVVGVNLAAGIGEGFEEEMKDVSKAMQGAIPQSFETSVNTAVSAVSASGAPGMSSRAVSPDFQVVLYLSDQSGQIFARTAKLPLDQLNGQTVTLSERGLAM